MSSDDVCRARYDQIAFAAQRCQRDRDDAADDHGHDAGDGGGVFSRERRWLLELGAMTVLESELETLSVADVASAAAATAEGNQHQEHSSSSSRGRERASYMSSCLEAMLDNHYDTLSEMRV